MSRLAPAPTGPGSSLRNSASVRPLDTGPVPKRRRSASNCASSSLSSHASHCEYPSTSGTQSVRLPSPGAEQWVPGLVFESEPATEVLNPLTFLQNFQTKGRFATKRAVLDSLTYQCVHMVPKGSENEYTLFRMAARMTNTPKLKMPCHIISTLRKSLVRPDWLILTTSGIFFRLDQKSASSLLRIRRDLVGLTMATSSSRRWAIRRRA